MKKILTTVLLIAAISTACAQKDVFTHKVGNIKISLLSETQRNAKTDILIGATSEMMAECVPDGTFPNSISCYLVETPEKMTLIDAGMGLKLFDNLNTVGVDPEKIDAVFITHLHGDHIGGLLKDGNPAFPCAEIYISKAEYENGADNKIFEAYQGKIQTFEPESPGVEQNALIPGIFGIKAYGHTPGYTAYMLESDENKLLVWGDLTHAMAIQMPYPQVAVTYDTDTETAISSRKEILEYVSEHKIPVAGMHTAFPGMGTITKNTKEGYVFTPFAE